MVKLSGRRMVLFLILITLPVAVLIQCMPRPEENTELEKKLEQAIREIDGKSMEDSLIVDITRYTNFEWDKLYTFTYPENPKRMQQTLGMWWGGARTLDEKDNLFVFVKDRKVVSHVFFHGTNFDHPDLYFDGGTARLSFTPRDAKFVVKKTPEVDPYLIIVYPLRRFVKL